MKNVKNDFPFFQNNENTIYLDNAATTQKPMVVIDKNAEYYGKYNSNIFRSTNKLSNIAENEYYKAKKVISNFVGMDENHISFSYNATDSLNTIVYNVLSRYNKVNGNIVLSSLEHHSNILPWIKWSKVFNNQIRYIPTKENGEVDYDSINNIIDENTICLSITGASNVNGKITNLELVSKICNEANIPLVLDLTQLIPHRRIDLSKIKFEYAAFSSHKVYGPQGVGVTIFGSNKALNGEGRVGGGMVKDVFDDLYIRKDGNQAFEAGTQNVSGIIGLGAAIEYLSENFEEYTTQEFDLYAYLISNLKNRSYIKLINGYDKIDISNQIPLVTFNIDGISASDANMLFDKYGIYVRCGKFCAYKAMKELSKEYDSAIRVSLGIYNDKNDIDVLLEKILMTLIVISNNEKIQHILSLDNDFDIFEYVTDIAFNSEFKEEICTIDNKLENCETNVYYKIHMEDQKVILNLESDSLFIKGLYCIYSEMIYNLSVKEILSLNYYDFLKEKHILPYDRYKGLKEVENKIKEYIKQERRN